MSNEKKKRRPRSGSRAARPGQKLLTGQQIDREYGVPYTSTRDLYLRGILPGVRLPGSRRLWFLRSDFERLIQSSRETVA